MTRLEVIGDFHSHTQASVDRAFSVRLSIPDKDSMALRNLGIIIAINDDRKRANGNIYQRDL